MPRLFLILSAMICIGVIDSFKLMAEEPAPKKKGSSNPPRAMLHRPLPEAITSFGAAVLNDDLYVFSGHGDNPPGSNKEALVNHFRRIRFDDPNAEWEELAMHSPAQSTALVTDGTYLYRIGGLSFQNSSQEPTNFHSTTHFARYDVTRNEWVDLAPLPEPRSSLDAAVLGRQIYVVGGWNLQGETSQNASWHETILRYDLDRPEAGWETLQGPGYITRALSVAAHEGKLYVMGGIQEREIIRTVSIYDPETETWSKGPDLLQDSSAAGFATSAFATGGSLYYTGGSGAIYRLSRDASVWEFVDNLLFPRMFLRLLPAGEDRLIALGGTGSGMGRLPIVESIRLVSNPETSPKLVSWTVPYSGRALHSQILVMDGSALYAFGGNVSPGPHDFSEKAFSDEAFLFDIGLQTVEALPSLPMPLQSGSGVVQSQTSEHRSVFIMGGLGHVEGEFQSLKTVFAFDPENQEWSQPASRLPLPRSMFTAVTYDEAIWMFGGSTVGENGGYHERVLHWWGDETAIAPLAKVRIPTPRRSFGGAMLNNEFYMVGGLGVDGKIVKTVSVFHLETREWRKAESPNVSRVFPSLAEMEGRLYLFGGFARTDDGHFAPENSLEVLDPETGKWTIVAESLPEVDASMSMLKLNSRLLFFGIDREEKQAKFVLCDPQPHLEPAKAPPMMFGPRGSSDPVVRNAKSLMRKDTDKDGQLSREELGSRLSGLFETADADQDGFLTYVELLAALKAEESEEENPSN